MLRPRPFAVRGVKQCAVVIDRSNTTEPFLIGYFTVKEEQPATVDNVRAHLGETLPPYMIPRFLVQAQRVAAPDERQD